MPEPFQSWGRYPAARQQVVQLRDRSEFPELTPGKTVLPYGLGRSYGDSCLNDGGILLSTRRLDRYLSFDTEQGILECEAGISFAEILQLMVPRGWCLSVMPGTQFITVGGAIANDVHGKNHPCAGSFGNHVLEFELQRSDGSSLRCSRQQNPEWFAATVGGLGLTGLIRSVRIQLRRIAGPWMVGERIKFSSLSDYFRVVAELGSGYEYSAAWVDAQARGGQLGRGLLSFGNHADLQKVAPVQRRFSIPFTPPMSLISASGMRLSNAWHYARQRNGQVAQHWHYPKFFHPLDQLLEWNRLYGPRGLVQYQCVLPPTETQAGLAEILGRIAGSGEAACLAVLKKFGDYVSPGLLSFPRAGVTLAVDFPYRGEPTLRLLDQLDQVTLAAGGRLYPAKDARMSAATFQRSFPRWREFSAYVDPAFSSSFWRRVNGGGGSA